MESVDDEELYNGIMDEISSGDIQSTMDKLLENQSFDFGDFVGKTINSGKSSRPFHDVICHSYESPICPKTIPFTSTVSPDPPWAAAAGRVPKTSRQAQISM